MRDNLLEGDCIMMSWVEAKERGLGCFKAFLLLLIPSTAFWLVVVYAVGYMVGWW